MDIDKFERNIQRAADRIVLRNQRFRSRRVEQNVIDILAACAKRPSNMFSDAEASYIRAYNFANGYIGRERLDL